MADPQGSWTDLALPFLAGAGALGAGFAAGRNPAAGDNPGAMFLQLGQFPVLMDQKRAQTEQSIMNAQHQRDMASYYQNLFTHQQNQDVQARMKTAIDATKTAVEMGDVAAVMQSKDLLGANYPSVLQTAQTRRQMLQRKGWIPADQPAPAQSPQIEGLPNTPALGPTSPPMQQPVGPPPNMGGEQSYRPDVTETFSMGGLSETRKTPGTTETAMVTDFLNNEVNKYQGQVPLPNQLFTDLYVENVKRSRQGYPSIPWDKNAQDVYMERLKLQRPEVWNRIKLQEQSVSGIPAETARIELGASGAQPTNPFQVQSERDIARAVQREEQVGTARQKVDRKYARLPEGERTKLQEMDDVLMNAAAVLDLKQDLVRKYGNRPGVLNAPIERLNETLGKQDPEMTRFLDLYGKLYNAARKRIAGTAVSAGEKQALETYLKDPRGNINTVFRGIEDIFRTTLAEGQRAMATAQTYGGEDVSAFAYNKIMERRKKGEKLYPELSVESMKRAPKLKYNPATKAIEPVPEG